MFNKKLPSGKYRFTQKYLDVNGEWKAVSCTMNSAGRDAKSEARNQLEKKIKEKLSKNLKAPNAKQTRTVNDVYFESAKVRKAELAESTFLSETYGLKEFLTLFGERAIKSVKPNEIQEYLFSKDYTNATRHTMKLRISTIFQYAYQMQFIEKNIVDMVIIPKQKPTIEGINKRRNKFFTPEEMNLLLSSMRNVAFTENEKRFVALTEFLFLTGLRFGEAAALQWSHVDLLNSQIYVEFSWSANLKKMGPTKNLNSVRFVSLTQRCIELIGVFKKVNYNSQFVFVKSNGYQISNSQFNQFLKIEGARANLKGKDSQEYSAHMLRHSHITMLAYMGIPQKAVMERVGHVDSRTTNNIYTHVLPESRAELQTKLESIRF